MLVLAVIKGTSEVIMNHLCSRIVSTNLFEAVTGRVLLAGGMYSSPSSTVNVFCRVSRLRPIDSGTPIYSVEPRPPLSSLSSARSSNSMKFANFSPSFSASSGSSHEWELELPLSSSSSDSKSGEYMPLKKNFFSIGNRGVTSFSLGLLSPFLHHSELLSAKDSSRGLDFYRLLITSFYLHLGSSGQASVFPFLVLPLLRWSTNGPRIFFPFVPDEESDPQTIVMFQSRTREFLVPSSFSLFLSRCRNFFTMRKNGTLRFLC